MATIPSTVTEFNEDFVKFHHHIGNKNHTNEQIEGAFKALSLRYLGLKDATDDEIEACAIALKVAHQGAIARGWII